MERHCEESLVRYEMKKSGGDEIAIVSEELIGSIRPLIEQAKAHVAQLVNSELVRLYRLIGKMIREEISARKIAGQEKGIVNLLSETLTMEYGPGLSRRNLFHMIRLADTFGDARTVQTLSAQLSWSHFIEIIYLKDPLQRQFYAEMTRVERWSVRTLRRKMQDMLYERTAISRKPEELARQELEALQEEDLMTPDLVFRDPYLLDFLGLKDTYSERDIEAAILREFLLYSRWLDRYERRSGEEMPIGLILCGEKNREQIELLQPDRGEIRVAEYLVELPPKGLLEAKLHEAIRLARGQTEMRAE
jgi:hypothetical protein